MALVISLASCNGDDDDDDNPQPTDYRDAFVGTYHGTRTNASWSMSTPHHITFEGPDSLSVAAVGDSMIEIAQDGPRRIGTDGIISEQGFGANSYQVTFSGSGIDYLMRHGGLGGGSSVHFEGYK